MPFTEAERTDIRRFCGYPVVGGALISTLVCGVLEVRINSLSDAESAVVRRYLATLAALEQAVPSAGDNLDTDQASVWTRNRDELRDRCRLLDDWRRRLCGFLGVAPGPSLGDGSFSLIV